MRQLIITVIIFLFYSNAVAAHLHKEKEYQAAWCKAAAGVTEYALEDGTRVDCLTDEYAIEFDFAAKWAESVGQSLYYAARTGKQPGVVLIMENAGDDRYAVRLDVLARQYHIKVWKMTDDFINQVSHGKFFLTFMCPRSFSDQSR